MRKRSESRAANCNPVRATQLISPHSIFSCMGLRPTESDYLLKTENRHKAPRRKMISYPNFVPFGPRTRRWMFKSGRSVFRTKLNMLESKSKATHSNQPRKLSMARIIRPHWKALSLAFVAVLCETFSDVLEPWPIKIVIDNILQSKKLPGWLQGFVTSAVGNDN